MTDIPLQGASKEIWGRKYQLKKPGGETIDKTVDGTFLRVAEALASVEKDPKKWEPIFYDAMKSGALPAGRIMSNAGSKGHKETASLINCTVSQKIDDSIEGIFDSVKQSALTLAAGCGIGYDFSTLRPRGAHVSGVGATTTGSLPFMSVFDSMCFTVASAGGRRGAQMATMMVWHPDILDYIRAKRTDGAFRQFNMSVLITDEFLEAVKNDDEWLFYFPYTLKSRANDSEGEAVYKKIHFEDDDYIVLEGKVLCKVYSRIKAKDLWDTITKSTFEFSEPGIILVDEYNRMNNLWFDEYISTCNPCAEQGLPNNGSCLLGSINLTKFVLNPFTPKAHFDFKSFKETVRVFTRMLDNVVELANLPLKAQTKEIQRKRRHGMGYLGLGSALAMLRIPYGSQDSITWTSAVTKSLVLEGWQAGVELAEEKGPAPIFLERDAPVKFCGSLHMQRVFEELPELEGRIKIHGCRFTHHSSIAPTGTLALSFGNNVSNGIEPSFAHEYLRNVVVSGKKTKAQVKVKSYEMLAFEAHVGHSVEVSALPDYFTVSDSLTPEQHIDVQAAAQYWIDSSISKTINVPTDIDYEDFKKVYDYAVEKSLKGCTTFRFNPEVFQGVLVKEDDLDSTSYSFTLADSSVVTFRGNEDVEYEGETHKAANLFDALKEGYYDKF